MTVLPQVLKNVKVAKKVPLEELPKVSEDKNNRRWTRA